MGALSMREVLAGLAVTAVSPLAAAQSSGLPAAQRGGTFHEPPAQVDPLYVPNGPNGAVRAADHPVLTLRLAMELPLEGGRTAAGGGTQGSRPRSPTLQAEVRLTPLEDRGWFASLRLYRYLRAERQRSWDPDFTYSFGYERYEPGTFSLVYANYTGTRFSPMRWNFPQGQWSAGWKFGLPQAWEPVFLAGDGDSALCNLTAHLQPRFVDVAHADLQRGKLSASLGCRYTAAAGWYLQGAVFAWRPGQQQAWDPDFTYGFGWQSGAFTAEYANYSGNRFPGRARAPGEGSIRNGSLLLSWTGQW